MDECLKNNAISPDALEQFVTLRVPLDRFTEAFEHRGGKATLVLSD